MEFCLQHKVKHLHRAIRILHRDREIELGIESQCHAFKENQQ